MIKMLSLITFSTDPIDHTEANPSPISQTATVTASILRTHSQCQTGKLVLPIISALGRRTGVFIIWIMVERLAYRAPSVVAKLRPVARFAALAALEAAQTSFARLSRLSAQWWSLSGSNR
jgi:hypothetical protein